MARVIVCGRGRVGRSLAAALRCDLVAGRDDPKAQSGDIVVITVPDQHLSEVAARLAGQLPEGVSVAHTSGSLGVEALDVLRPRPLGAFHPLQAFAADREPSAFENIIVGIDATDEVLFMRLSDMARALGARPRRVTSEERLVYHAAAVLSSGAVVALFGRATALLVSLGWSMADARSALMPLLNGAVDNLASNDPAHALTGPIRRGDVATVERHLAALAGDGLDRQVYKVLGEAAVLLSREAGLAEATADELKKALTKQ